MYLKVRTNFTLPNLSNPVKNYKVLKVLLIAITIPVIVFLAFFFLFGGGGKKTINPGLDIPPDSSIFFAHRGIVNLYPENSLESIGEAKRRGFRAIEIDLRKSAEGDFILFHDIDCRRMLGAGFDIEDVPLVNLKKFPFLQNEKATPWFVPTLKEVLDRHHSDFIFYLDMKLTGFKEADQIVEVIRKYGIVNSSVVASADLIFTLYIEYKYPEINTALEGYNAGKEWTYRLFPKNLKPDYLSGFFNRVDDHHIAWLKKEGLLSRRIVYGIDSSNFRAAEAMGLRHFILDYDTTSRVFDGITTMHQQ